MAELKENKKENKKLKGEAGPGTENRKPRFNITWIYVLIILAFLSMWLFNKDSGEIETNQKYFETEMLAKGDVEKIVIVNGKTVEVYIKSDKLDQPKYKKVLERGFGKFARTGPHFYFTIPSVDHFLEQLDKAQENLPPSERIYYESATRKDFGEMFGWLILPLMACSIQTYERFFRWRGFKYF